MKGLIMLLLSPLFLINAIQASCVKGNCKIGFGVFLFPDGSKYIGNFKHGNPDGKGKIFLKEGDVYEGTFVKGKMHGEGKYYFKSGDVFIGQFNNNDIEGKGRMDYSDDTTYKGEWRKNQPDGKGIFTDAKGKEQHGYWKGGKMINKITVPGVVIPSATVGREYKNCNKRYCDNENGKFTYGDGSFYIGKFQDGQPYGVGVCYYANGDVYEGGWKNHGPDGKGLITFASGKKYSTIWKHGKPTRQVFDPPVVESSDFNSKPAKADGVTEMYALIVGVSSYDHLPALKFPDDDAYHIYAFLKSPEGGALPESNISLLVDDVATKENIRSSMKRIFGKADMDDVIIMYYSGHGLEGRLLPIDYDGYNNSLAHSEIYDLLDKSVAKNKILIADACHSGSMTEKKVEFRNSLDNFYKKLQGSEGGTAVIMSSKAEEKSLEYSGLRQGVFSHFLMRGMKGEADYDNNSIVSISELFNYTSEQVRMYTDNRQSPTISGTYDHNMPIAMIRQ